MQNARFVLQNAPRTECRVSRVARNGEQIFGAVGALDDGQLGTTGQRHVATVCEIRSGGRDSFLSARSVPRKDRLAILGDGPRCRTRDSSPRMPPHRVPDDLCPCHDLCGQSARVATV